MSFDGVVVWVAAVVLALAGLSAGILLSRVCGWRPAGGLTLIAATPVAPHVALGMGLSLDDILALVGVAFLLVVLGQRVPRSTVARPTNRPTRQLLVVLFVGLALLVIAAAVSSVVNAPSSGEGLRMFLRSGGRYAFLGLVGVLAAISEPPALRVAVVTRAVAAMGIFEAVFGLAAFLLPFPDRLGLEPTKSYSVLSGEVPGRIAGTLGLSPDFLGALFVFSIPLTVALALDASRSRDRGLWSAASALQLLALGLTFTRSSLAVVIVALVVLLLLRGRLVYLVGLGATLAPVALLTPAVARLTSDIPDRLALWTAGLRMMLDHPLFGVGSDMTKSVLRANPDRYMDTPFGVATNTPHNTILLAGAELGVMGFIGALLVNVALGLLALRLLWICRGRSWSMTGAAAALSILAFLTQGMVNDLFTVAVVGTVAALVIGSHSLQAVAREDLAAVRLTAAGRPPSNQVVQRAPRGEPSVPRE